MTGRTHDLAAFTALSYITLTQPLQELSLGTILIAFGANMVGGLAPDLDQPTSSLWHRVRAGSLIGRIIYPLFGGHRFISHSIIGIIFFGVVLNLFLKAASQVVLVDMEIVWWSFMIGFVSHLFMDMLTREGVPWLFPIPIRFGIPPFRFLRMKTGGMLEKSFVFPLLLVVNGYLYYANYGKVLEFLRYFLK